MEATLKLVQAGVGGSGPTITRTLGQHSDRTGGALQVEATRGDLGPHPGNSGGGRRKDPGERGSGASGTDP